MTKKVLLAIKQDSQSRQNIPYIPYITLITAAKHSLYYLDYSSKRWET